MNKLVFLQSFELQGFDKPVKMPFGLQNNEAKRLWAEEIQVLCEQFTAFVNESNTPGSPRKYVGPEGRKMSWEDMDKMLTADRRANPGCILPDPMAVGNLNAPYTIVLKLLKLAPAMFEGRVYKNSGIDTIDSRRFVGFEDTFDTPKTWQQFEVDIKEQALKAEDEAYQNMHASYRGKNEGKLPFEHTRFYGHLQQYWKTLTPDTLAKDAAYWELADEDRYLTHSDISMDMHHFFASIGFRLGDDVAKKLSNIIAIAFPHPNNPAPRMLLERAGYTV